MNKKRGFFIKLAVIPLVMLQLIYIKASGFADTREISAVFNDQYLENCIQMIENAKSTLSIAEYYFKNDPVTAKIEKALKKALDRNVSVKLILDGSIKENTDAVRELSALGVQARLTGPERKLHAKFLISDSSAVLVGSTNFSEKSIKDNNEVNMLIKSPGPCEGYRRYFEALWHGESFNAQTNLLSSDPNEEIIPVFDRAYFERAMDLINSSNEDIGAIIYMAHFMPKYYSSKPNRLLRALTEARRKGIRVRVILERSDHDKELNEINKKAYQYLIKNEVDVKYDSAKKITHAKLLLCGRSALLGSTNWVISGLEKNHEANVLVRNSSAVDDLWQYFEDLWSEY